MASENSFQELQFSGLFLSLSHSFTHTHTIIILRGKEAYFFFSFEGYVVLYGFYFLLYKLKSNNIIAPFLFNLFFFFFFLCVCVIYHVKTMKILYFYNSLGNILMLSNVEKLGLSIFLANYVSLAFS
jgi:hypothetical protein